VMVPAWGSTSTVAATVSVATAGGTSEDPLPEALRLVALAEAGDTTLTNISPQTPAIAITRAAVMRKLFIPAPSSFAPTALADAKYHSLIHLFVTSPESTTGLPPSVSGGVPIAAVMVVLLVRPGRLVSRF